MFYSSLRASFIVLAASAAVVSAAPSLALKTSPPRLKVDGVENLKITTTVTNIGNVTLKLLRDPRGVLDHFPEDTFDITNDADSHPEFIGASVKYIPEYAARLDDPSGFTVLAPGASIDVVHDLSAAYDFTESGAGDYSIEPSNLFTYVDANDTPKDFRAYVEGVTEVELSGNLAVPHVFEGQVVFAGCHSTSKQAAIEAAVNKAQDYADLSFKHVKGLTGGDDYYTTWFGDYTDRRKNTVKRAFKAMTLRPFATSYTYDCGTCINTNWAAFVRRRRFGTIYICPGFWGLTKTGANSRAGTLVHEASHFVLNGGTIDDVYGRDASRELARIYPLRAIHNADSYEYFAEAVSTRIPGKWRDQVLLE